MKTRFYHEKGFYLTLLTSALITIIAIVTEHLKNLFVHETGNIKIIGGIGVALAIGMLFKIKYTRQILATLVLLSIIAMISILINSEKEYLLANSILLITLVFIEYQLFFSIPILRYVKK